MMTFNVRIRNNFIDIVWEVSALVHELEQHDIIEYEWRHEILVPVINVLDITFITDNIMEVI